MDAAKNESQLVAQACQGSSTAFEELVKTYEYPIKCLLYGMTNDVHSTQDLCQETFLAAYRALPCMDSNELHFASWLYRIALNLVRSEWRRRKHVSLVSFYTAWRDDEDQSEYLVEAGLINEDHFEAGLINEDHFEERIVKQDLVRRALAQLPTTSALCLLLDAEGFTYSEIAEMLQVSLAAVRSRLARARQGFEQIYHRLDQEER